MTVRTAASGFTLIEALIALAVLAITAVSFLNATEANVRRVGQLESRAAAAWVAQNRLAELALKLPTGDGPVEMMGRRYAVAVTATPSAEPGLIQVDIAVAETGGAPLAHLTGFVPLRPEAGL